MNVRVDCQSKSTQGHGHRDVRCCYARRVTKAKVLVTYVNRKSDGRGQEGQSIPGNMHRTGLRPAGERAECDADDTVHRTQEYYHSEPPLATIHVCGPTFDFDRAAAISASQNRAAATRSAHSTKKNKQPMLGSNDFVDRAPIVARDSNRDCQT